MEKERIIDAIHGAIESKNIKNYTRVSDFYKDGVKADISKLKVEVVNEHIEVFTWALANTDYDFNNAIETPFTNQELLKYFHVYLEDCNFVLNKKNNKDYIIKHSDFEEK